MSMFAAGDIAVAACRVEIAGDRDQGDSRNMEDTAAVDTLREENQDMGDIGKEIPLFQFQL